MFASVPDLLRLVVIPVFAWAAYRDVKTRRIPNQTWIPLAVLAVVLFTVDALAAFDAGGVTWRLFAVRAVVSVGLIVPLSFAFWWQHLFGGADFKALAVLAILVPTYPVYYLPGDTLPLVVPPLGVFSLTILTNGVLAGAGYPVVLAARNLLAGHVSRIMFVAHPVPFEDLSTAYGRIMETNDGYTRRGLDLDALRMYLRWRDLDLADLRGDPDRYRDPDSLPVERFDPGDGAVADGGRVEDPWGAAQFMAAVDGSAYGTSPETLREGLDVVTERDAIWVTPGTPFMVPLFAGIVLAFTFGDVLYAILHVLGVA